MTQGVFMGLSPNWYGIGLLIRREKSHSGFESPWTHQTKYGIVTQLVETRLLSGMMRVRIRPIPPNTMLPWCNAAQTPD